MRLAPQETRAGVPGDPRVARAVSRLLLAGLIVAIGLMLAGAIIAAVRGAGSVEDLSSITRLPHLLATLDATGFIDLGLLVLLATPAARVVALLIVFAARRQWLFAGVSFAVMVILALSAFLALALA
jgi:uncharacterized membrane protein